MGTTMFVRLKPYSVRTRQLMQRYTCQGTTFEASFKGLYEVPVELADYLRTIRSVPGDPRSPLAFDIFDSVEAAEKEKARIKALDEVARLRAAHPQVEKAEPVRVGALTTASLPKPTPAPEARPVPKIAPPPKLEGVVKSRKGRGRK